MRTIRLEQDAKVAIARLDRGVTNALGPQVIHDLAELVELVKNDQSIASLVLGSANEKFFSIGLDIPYLFRLAKPEFAAFWAAFNRTCLELYTLPKPTLAAITGHAIAGGCILALCCDYRLIAEGRKLMGLNEIKLGVPIPYLIDCMLPGLVGGRVARDVVESGEFYPPDRLHRMGMVDRVVHPEKLMAQAIEKARALGEMPREAYAMIKRNRVEVVEARVRERLVEKQRWFVACWYSDSARSLLKEAMERF